MRRVRLRHRVSHDNSFAWVALLIWEIRVGNLILKDIDAHITLFYVKEAALPDLEGMLQAIQKQLEKAIAKNEFVATMKVNEAFASENYAWADILVFSKVHPVLHRLTNAARQSMVRGASARDLCTKQAQRESIFPIMTHML